MKKIILDEKIQARFNPTPDLFPKEVKSTLMVFFAPWCDVCKGEMPKVNEIRKENAGCGFQVLGVAIEKDGPLIAEAIKEWKVEFPVIQDVSYRLKRFFDVTKIPTFVLLDEKGNSQKVQISMTGLPDFYRKLNTELKKQNCAGIRL